MAMVFGNWRQCNGPKDPTMHYTSAFAADTAFTACKREIGPRVLSFIGRTIIDPSERVAAAKRATTCKSCRKAMGWEPR